MPEERSVVADTDGRKIYVTCKSILDKDLVSLVPGAKWRENQSHYELNLTWASAKQLRAIFKNNLEVTDTLADWGYEELQSRVQPCMALRDLLNPGQPYPNTFHESLYPYQVAGAQFLSTAKHAILSDPPGAGKTATAISAAKVADALPALVVAPKSTLVSWGREVERWWPGTPTYVISGTKAKKEKLLLEARHKPGFVIINWESMRLHSRLAPYGSTRLSQQERQDKDLNVIPFRLVIADEAHRMADPKSKQTRAVWAVGDMGTVDYRWALTGTPLTDQIDTIYPILRFVKKDEWPSKVAFVDRYALTRVVSWGSGLEVIGLNEDHEEEFQEIFQPRFRRMPKEVILPQLPPIIRTRRYLEMSEKQSRLYEQMVEDMVAETDTGELIIAANPAVKMLRAVQFSSACADVMINDDMELAVRLTNESNKLDALMDDLPDLIAAGESVLVFAMSRQLIELAEDRLQAKKIPYSVIKGDQTTRIRQINIDDFQQRKNQVCLIVIAAGGVGVTLTAARIGIFLQRSWSFVDNNQAEGRFNRIGSEIHEFTEIIDYISRGTADETVVEVAEGKAIRLEEIVKDREATRRLLHGEVD